MEPGLTPSPKPHPDAGFTLIEGLITVAILAILTVGATLSIAGRSAGPRSDVAQFRQAFDTTRQLAITGQQSRGLRLDPGGLRRAVQTKGIWQLSEQQQSWQGQAILVLPQDSRGYGLEDPNILFLRTGQTSSFTLYFTSNGRRTQCHSDGWTGLICDD